MRQTRASSVCHGILTSAAAFVTHTARVSSFATRSLASHMSYQVWITPRNIYTTCRRSLLYRHVCCQIYKVLSKMPKASSNRSAQRVAWGRRSRTAGALDPSDFLDSAAGSPARLGPSCRSAGCARRGVVVFNKCRAQEGKNSQGRIHGEGLMFTAAVGILQGEGWGIGRGRTVS